MPTREISPTREGKDQRSDSPTKDVARSQGKVRDFATRRETCQYATHSDLSQQGVGEQAYERECARKGKKLVVHDETSRHSDTSSSSGYSSGSDSEKSALLQASWSENEKLVLTDKSGLRGGGNESSSFAGGNAFSLDRQLLEFERSAISSIQASEARAAAEARRDLEMLGKLIYRSCKKGKERKQMKEFSGYIADITAQIENSSKSSFDDFKKVKPDGSYEQFIREKESLVREKTNEIRHNIDMVKTLGIKGWKTYRKQYERSLAKYSDAGTSTSRG